MEHDAPLTARLYGEKLGDYQLVTGWREGHGMGPLMETILPPIGVIVERDGKPMAALWCYQSFGVGVAFLEGATTAPGLTASQAREALTRAIAACVRLAKADGDFSLFRISTIPAIARFLPALGFIEEGERLAFATRID